MSTHGISSARKSHEWSRLNVPLRMRSGEELLHESAPLPAVLRALCCVRCAASAVLRPLCCHLLCMAHRGP